MKTRAEKMGVSPGEKTKSKIRKMVEEEWERRAR